MISTIAINRYYWLLKRTGSVLVGLLSFAGCHEHSRCDGMRMNLERELVQEQLNHWVELNVLHGRSLEDSFEYSPGGGIGLYRLVDGIPLPTPTAGLRIEECKILGEIESPVAVVFLTNDWCDIIFILKEDEVLGQSDIRADELDWVTDKIAIFERPRG